MVDATGATLPVITTRYLTQPPVKPQVSEATQWWKFTLAARGGYFCSTAGVASAIAAMGEALLESNAPCLGASPSVTPSASPSAK